LLVVDLKLPYNHKRYPWGNKTDMTLKISRAVLSILVVLFVFVAKPTSAQPANISIDSDLDFITITWQETSADPVDYYLLESSQDNGATWDPIPVPPSSNTYLQFPRSFYVNVHPVDFDIRITTVFQDTSMSAPTTASLAIPIYPGYDQVTNRFALQPAQVIATDAERKAEGLDFWIDGNLGLFERGGQIVSVSVNGSDTARIIADGSNIFGTVTDSNVLIQNQSLSSDHASGGPVYYDEPNDRLLMFYHGEFHDPDPLDFYSYLGLAQSYDGGETFDDLGQIISPGIDITSPSRAGAVEMAGAPYIIHDGYFYVYYKDKLPDNSVVNVGVARAAVADVLADAANDTVGSWTKYDNGSFSEPGIGGTSENIFLGYPNAVWFDTAYSEQLDEYIMVYSHESGQQYSHLITTSADGINWTTPELLYDQPSSYEEPYVTITSPDFSNQRTIPGDSFYILKTVSATGFTAFRWDDAWIEQNEILINLSSSQNPPSQEIPPDSNDESSETLAQTGLDAHLYGLISAVLIVSGAAFRFFIKPKLIYSIKT